MPFAEDVKIGGSRGTEDTFCSVATSGPLSTTRQSGKMKGKKKVEERKWRNNGSSRSSGGSRMDVTAKDAGKHADSNRSGMPGCSDLMLYSKPLPAKTRLLILKLKKWWPLIYFYFVDLTL